MSKKKKKKKLTLIGLTLAVAAAGVFAWGAHDAQSAVVAGLEKPMFEESPSEIRGNVTEAFKALPIADDEMFESTEWESFKKAAAENTLSGFNAEQGNALRQDVLDELWWPGMRERAKAAYVERDKVNNTLADLTALMGTVQIASGACEFEGMTREDFGVENKAETDEFNKTQGDWSWRIYQAASKHCD